MAVARLRSPALGMGAFALLALPWSPLVRCGDRAQSGPAWPGPLASPKPGGQCFRCPPSSSGSWSRRFRCCDSARRLRPRFWTVGLARALSLGASGSVNSLWCFPVFQHRGCPLSCGLPAPRAGGRPWPLSGPGLASGGSSRRLAGSLMGRCRAVSPRAGVAASLPRFHPFRVLKHFLWNVPESVVGVSPGVIWHLFRVVLARV